MFCRVNDRIHTTVTGKNGGPNGIKSPSVLLKNEAQPEGRYAKCEDTHHEEEVFSHVDLEFVLVPPFPTGSGSGIGLSRAVGLDPSACLVRN